MKFLFLNFLCSCVFTTLYHLRADAQVVSNRGTEFWVAFPTHVPDFDKQFNLLPAQISIFITAEAASSGKVNAGNFSASFNVAANGVSEVRVPRDAAYINDTENGQVLANRAIHIKVDEARPKVAVYAHIFAGQRSAASLVLPAESLGNNYYSMNFGQHDTEGQNYIAIVATEPGTKLHIKRGSTELVAGGITLNNVNDVYEFLSNDDLTGVNVSIDENYSACRHFAMFSGSSGVYIAQQSCTPKSLDPLFQQCYPAESWGRAYGYIPFSSQSLKPGGLVRTAGQYLRVVAGERQTDVSIDGVHVASLAPGTFYTSPQPLAAPAYISATEPVMVGQFALSQSCSNNGNGSGYSDPDMVLLNPVNFSIQDITVYSSTRENISEQYLNVLIPTDGASGFRINGATPSRPFVPLPTLPGYSYLQLNLNALQTSTFHLTAGKGFNAVAYGFGDVESYAYSAGTNLAGNQSLSAIKNTSGQVIDSACVNDDFFFRLVLPYSTPKISWKMDISDSPVIQQNPVAEQITIDGRKAYVYTLNKTPSLAVPGVHQYTVTVDYPQSIINCGSGSEVLHGDFKTIPLPIVAFNSKPGLCDNIVAFENTGTKADNKNTITWNFGDISSGDANTSNLENPQHAFSSGGTYTITMSINSVTGCGSTISKPITLTEKIRPVFHSGPATCQGQEITVTDDSRSTPAFTIASRSWDFGDGQSATATDASVAHRYKNPGTYKIRLTLQSTAGCVSKTTENTIDILPKPVPDFVMPDICISNGKAQFINQSKAPNGSNAELTYFWDFGDDKATPGNPGSSTLQNPIHFYSEAKTYKVSLTVTSKNNCDSTIAKQLTVNAPPVAGFDMPVNGPFCSGENIVFRNRSATSYGSITRLVWYFNADEDPMDKMEIIHPVAGETYSHTYPTIYGPRTSVQRKVKLVAYAGTDCFDEVSQTIELFTVPKLQFAPIPNVCANAEPFQINGVTEISGLTGGSTSFSGEGVFGDGWFNPAIAGVGQHTVTCHFTNAAGCTQNIDQQIKVLTPPQIDLTGTIRILKGEQVTLKPVYHGENLTYKWYPATGLDNSLVPFPVASPADNTTYRVEVSNGSCSAFAEVTVNVLLPPVINNTFTPNSDGKNDTWEIPNIAAYPNAEINIFNRYGIKIFNSRGYQHPWDGRYNGEPVPAGTYYYIIKPGGGQKTYSGHVTVLR